MIYTTKSLVHDKGILCDANKRIGTKFVHEDTAKKIKEFYYSDDISRACPGIREYIMKSDANGEKEKVQRRLILMNLREAYILFKDEFKDARMKRLVFPDLRLLGQKSACLLDLRMVFTQHAYVRITKT